jgi:hypothetical protein
MALGWSFLPLSSCFRMASRHRQARETRRNIARPQGGRKAPWFRIASAKFPTSSLCSDPLRISGLPGFSEIFGSEAVMLAREAKPLDSTARWPQPQTAREPAGRASGMVHPRNGAGAERVSTRKVRVSRRGSPPWSGMTHTRSSRRGPRSIGAFHGPRGLPFVWANCEYRVIGGSPVTILCNVDHRLSKSPARASIRHAQRLPVDRCGEIRPLPPVGIDAAQLDTPSMRRRGVRRSPRRCTAATRIAHTCTGRRRRQLEFLASATEIPIDAGRALTLKACA